MGTSTRTSLYRCMFIRNLISLEWRRREFSYSICTIGSSIGFVSTDARAHSGLPPESSPCPLPVVGRTQLSLAEVKLGCRHIRRSVALAARYPDPRFRYPCPVARVRAYTRPSRRERSALLSVPSRQRHAFCAPRAPCAPLPPPLPPSAALIGLRPERRCHRGPEFVGFIVEVAL